MELGVVDGWTVGFTEGIDEGDKDTEGLFVGVWGIYELGFNVGKREGLAVGKLEMYTDGELVEMTLTIEGGAVGFELGLHVGNKVGTSVDALEGSTDGLTLGKNEGSADGPRVGSVEGELLNKLVGSDDGIDEGIIEGDSDIVGEILGSPGIYSLVGEREDGSEVGISVGDEVGMIEGLKDGDELG